MKGETTVSVVLITGASIGIGNLTAKALAADGHTIYATPANWTSSSRTPATWPSATPKRLLPRRSPTSSMSTRSASSGSTGPCCPTCVRRSGMLLYVGSTTTVSVPPFLGPCVASKFAFDALAQVTSYEASQFGIETVIVMPGAFTQGTEHFPNASHAGDQTVSAAYAVLDPMVARQRPGQVLRSNLILGAV